MRDNLNDIGILKRREIEARIIGPILQAFTAELGPEKTRDIARQVIVQIAQEQGESLARQIGSNSLSDFADAMAPWTRDGALEIEILDQTDHVFSFNVTRCRYAEMYKALGMSELGSLLSCNRDEALCGGFNPGMQLTRTQTIMEGASHCDFRYRTCG